MKLNGACNLVIFGGNNDYYEKLCDLWTFNTETCTWEEIEAGEGGPGGRSGACAGNYKDKYLLVFGGIYEITNELNDVFLYNFEDKKWSQIT